MDLNNPFFVDATLPPQPEPLSTVAGRLTKLLGLLTAIDPLLSEWFYLASPGTPARLTLDPALLERLIYEQSCFDGAKAPRLAFGYCFGGFNKATPKVRHPLRMNIMMKAGGDGHNRVWLNTDSTVVADPNLVTYAIIKKMLFAVTDAFEPIISKAYPSALNRDDWAPKKTNPIQPGWMFLLPKALASQVTPPASTITQTRANGSLFMAVTDETFDVTNPDHVAGSKAMQAAIAPINHRSLFRAADTPGRS